MFTLSISDPAKWWDPGTVLSDDPGYTIIDFDGLSLPDVKINTSAYAGFDGSVFDSAYVSSRTLTLTMVINPPIADNRNRLYQLFETKKPLNLHFNGVRGDTWANIEVYVQSIQVGLFDQRQTAQIVMQCPEPRIEGRGQTVMFDNRRADFTYAGDLSTGAVYQITARGADVVNPLLANSATMQGNMSFDITIPDGQTLKINTNRGDKSVVLEDPDADTETNALSSLTPGSSWIQLVPGNNWLFFQADAGQDTAIVTVGYATYYAGV